MKNRKIITLVFVTCTWCFFSCVSQKRTQTQTKSDIIDVLPQFPGGSAGWANYLSQSLIYPNEARMNNISGKVILSFVVEKDGSLNEIKVVKGLGWGCDEEALRVLQNSPAWKPGMDGGKLVRVVFTMPISFQLTSAKKY